MASQHFGTFTWGAGPNSVHVAGGFNNWSDAATPLEKQADGTFKADVPMPWGEKQAFKYIVDGEWKVREDEAKEWDAAGNMNNVYTAPHKPESAPTGEKAAAAPATAPAPGPAVAAVPVPAAVTDVPSKHEAAPVLSKEPARAAAVTAKEPAAPAVDAAAVAEPAPVAPVAAKTDPLASLGKPLAGGASPSSAPVAVADIESKPAPVSDLPAVADVSAPAPSAVAALEEQSIVRPADKETAPVVVPLNASAPVFVPTKAEEIERIAASAPIGESSTAAHEEGVLERAAAFGATALAGLTAAAGTAAIGLERVTGIDLAHGNPISVEEARKQGIDVDTLPEHEIQTEAVSPVGIPPSKAAVADLEEKVNELKVDSSSAKAPAPITPTPVPASAAGPSPSATAKGPAQGVAAVPLPAAEPPKRSEVSIKPPAADNMESQKHDLPAQEETGANHKTIPAPQITTLTEKDPRHDRTLQGTNNVDSIATKPISNDPAIDAKQAKHDAEAHPGLNGSTGSTAQSAQSKPAQDRHIYATAGTASTPVGGPAAPGPLPAGSAAAAPDQKEANFDAPPPVRKDNVAAKPVSATQAPATPPKAKANGTATAASTPAPAGIALAQPGSINSTPASTPVKAAHGKEATGGSDIRKRKSSFFHKIKSAFSPKDKKEKEAK